MKFRQNQPSQSNASEYMAVGGGFDSRPAGTRLMRSGYESYARDKVSARNAGS